MTTVIELETEQGTLLYLNPDHVASVIAAASEEPAIAIVWAQGVAWRVKGNSREIAAHIFAEVTEYGFRVVRIVHPGQPARRERVSVVD